MLKKILIGLGGLIALLIIVAFFLPGKTEVSKSATINAPDSVLFAEINSLERWQTWQYWNTLDDKIIITYGDKKEGQGANYSWDGPKMGKGTITITESVPNRSVATDLLFSESNLAKALYTLEPDGGGTKMTMNFSAENGMNPIARWMGVIMKPEIEKSFDYALDKLKEKAGGK
jgi:hypothetical protein